MDGKSTVHPMAVRLQMIIRGEHYSTTLIVTNCFSPSSRLEIDSRDKVNHLLSNLEDYSIFSKLAALSSLDVNTDYSVIAIFVM